MADDVNGIDAAQPVEVAGNLVQRVAGSVDEDHSRLWAVDVREQRLIIGQGRIEEYDLAPGGCRFGRHRVGVQYLRTGRLGQSGGGIAPDCAGPEIAAVNDDPRVCLQAFADLCQFHGIRAVDGRRAEHTGAEIQFPSRARGDEVNRINRIHRHFCQHGSHLPDRILGGIQDHDTR